MKIDFFRVNAFFRTQAEQWTYLKCNKRNKAPSYYNVPQILDDFQYLGLSIKRIQMCHMSHFIIKL